MYSVYKFYIFSIVFLIIFSIVFVYSSSYNYVVDRKIFMNGSIDVVYKASLEKPRALVKIYNVDYNDPVVLSMFIWMPNGSVVDIGKTFFKGSYGEIDYKYLANVYDEWNRHLKVIGARPGSIDIGLILLGTIHKKDGVYTLATAVPLNPEYISKRLGIEITINKKLIKTLDIEEIKKINISKRSEEIKFSEKESLAPIAHAQTTWPPNEIIAYCPDGGCWVWRLDESKVAYNVDIPLVATAINYRWDRVHGLTLREHVVANSRAGVNVVFGIGAGIGDKSQVSSGSVDYQILGYDIVLKDETAASLDFYRAFFSGADFNGESILYVGFKGDIAYVRYVLAFCGYWCSYTTIYANTTMVRPLNGGPLTNNVAVSGAVSMYDYNNVINQVYRGLLETGWFQSPYNISYGVVYVDTFIIKSEQNTLPQLTLSVDVIQMLIALKVLRSRPTFGSLALILAATVGVDPYITSNTELLGVANVLLSERWDWAYYLYARSPVKYKYGSSQYTITMMFVDVWVDVPTKPYERSYS